MGKWREKAKWMTVVIALFCVCGLTAILQLQLGSNIMMTDMNGVAYNSFMEHLSETERTLQVAYMAVAGREPSMKERCDLYSVLKSGEMTYDDLLWTLCSKLPRSMTSSHYCKAHTLSEAAAKVLEKGLRGDNDGGGGDKEKKEKGDKEEEEEGAVDDIISNMKVVTPVRWSQRWPDKVYLWSTDLHAGPIACNMPVLKDAGVIVHPEIDFPNCLFFGVCKDRLQVLSYDDWRGFSLDPDPVKLKKDFYDYLRNDEEFSERVDAVICSHPVANCELYLPFSDVAIVVYATTRLEFGRDDAGVSWRVPYITEVSPKRFQEWVRTIIEISKKKNGAVLANNKYDALYIQYHTGIEVEVIASWCGDNDSSYGYLQCDQTNWRGLRNPMMYNPARETKDTVLIGPYRTNLASTRFGVLGDGNVRSHPIMKEFFSAFEKYKEAAKTENQKAAGSWTPMKKVFDLQLMEEMEDRSPDVVSQHLAIVLMPYQVSTISIFEYYRMNIPLFTPSVDLLCRWHAEHDILFERIYGWPKRQVDVMNELDMVVLQGLPDPNDNTAESFRYWIGQSDFYSLPNIAIYDSAEHLMELLSTTDYAAVSRRMQIQNVIDRKEIVRQWEVLFARLLVKK